MAQTRADQWRNVAKRFGVSTNPPAATPRIQTREALREVIAEDLRAQGLGRYRWHYRFTNRVVRFQVLLRRAEYWDSSGSVLAVVLAPLSRLRVIRLGEVLGFTVPLHVTAPGFSIAHPGTVVISTLATVGRRCRLHSDVCIGELKGVAPVIGDNVWIGPGAKIFGRVTVGDGVAIGANAVVTSDVPPGVTVAGIPARIVSENGSAELQLHF
jgi:serine O-acetyltransferase